MIRFFSVFAATILLVAGLAACGGGSVSSGGGGGGGGSKASSSLVVELGSDRRVAAAHQGVQQERTLGDVIAGLLVRNAIAQTAGVAIFVDGDQVAVTDEGGSAVIPLPAGTYEVCVVDPTVSDNCTTVTVEPDSVVVVSDVNIDEEGLVTFGAITSESAEDNIVAFQDPDNANKTIICHQTGSGRQLTISVGTPAAMNGHLGHGDSAGACPTNGEEEGEAQISGQSNGGGNGNNGNNGNSGNGNNGNGNRNGNNGNNGNGNGNGNNGNNGNGNGNGNNNA